MQVCEAKALVYGSDEGFFIQKLLISQARQDKMSEKTSRQKSLSNMWSKTEIYPTRCRQNRRQIE
jgi:hypothetical protein